MVYRGMDSLSVGKDCHTGKERTVTPKALANVMLYASRLVPECGSIGRFLF
jgi:hypothetical protein